MPDDWSAEMDDVMEGNLYVTYRGHKARLLQLQTWEDIDVNAHSDDYGYLYFYNALYCKAWPECPKTQHGLADIEVRNNVEGDKMTYFGLYNVSYRDELTTWRTLRQCVHSRHLEWTPIDDEDVRDIDDDIDEGAV